MGKDTAAESAETESVGEDDDDDDDDDGVVDITVVSGDGVNDVVGVRKEGGVFNAGNGVTSVAADTVVMASSLIQSCTI
jgi:hypothetical protein